MSKEQILAQVREFEGLVELAPTAGSGYPELSWGDHFFYYAPDGQIPTNRQPYATIVTKDYPGDGESRLDSDAGRWRLNVRVSPQTATELVGDDADHAASGPDRAKSDVFFGHPSYGGWVSVVNPGEATLGRALAALREAHLADRDRVERREAGSAPQPRAD